MEPRVIKSEAQYRDYLVAIEELAVHDPPPDSCEGARLELLSVLVEDYEKSRYAVPLPSPIDAIIFRMEQQGLRQKDLVPYIGSKSKVSEVLSGKRQLTLKMVRALSTGLDIPPAALLNTPKKKPNNESPDEWNSYPVREMAKRGWLGDVAASNPDTLIEKVRDFFAQVGGAGVGPAYFRRTMHLGGDVSTDVYAMNAWLARVLVRSRDLNVDRERFKPNPEPIRLMREVAQLSWTERGPILAREYLHNQGICVVIEPHLRKTHLDGAALLDVDGSPVIGLTLRHDRIDNFWFTLLHELAHVLCHISTKQEAFVDNTEHDPNGEKRETEANSLAKEALIPRSVWRRSDAFRRQTVQAINSLASELHIHPAIVAGRIRKETGNYRRFPKLVGYGQVRRLFLSSV